MHGKMFKTNKTLDRLNNMLDNAIAGTAIEKTFDESKVSQIESKLHKYIATTGKHKQQLNDEKQKINSLISDISHQTKTPVANILLYSELIVECDEKDDIKKYSENLKIQAQKLDFLIASLVKTSRLENGIIVVNPKPQSIELLFESVKSSYEKVVITNSKALANYDLKWLCEAVFNILDNAFKYGATAVSINSTEYEQFLRLDIKDNGTGISEEETAKIFTRFYRGQNTAEIEGVGIGLYLAREIITKQGGYIKVSSTLGKGSIFSVFLPKK